MRRLRDLLAKGRRYLASGTTSDHIRNGTGSSRRLRGRSSFGVMWQEPPRLERTNEQDADNKAFNNAATRPLGLQRDCSSVIRQGDQRRTADHDLHLRTIRDHQLHRTILCTYRLERVCGVLVQTDWLSCAHLT